MENSLAIAIPTYNRAGILLENLLNIIDDLIEFKIPVYISDDSTNSETALIVEKLKKKHSLFFYKKNEIGLGHDLNCIHTISLPKEDYVWYLGDSMIIKKGSIEKVLEIINKDEYDFICCNAEGRNLDIKDKVFEDEVEAFENLCWHLTLTGATIYNKKRITSLNNFDISLFKNFPQTAIIFEQLASQASKLYWNNEKLIYANLKKQSYWGSKVFEVFIDDFKTFLFNLNSKYSFELKNKVVTQHSLETHIFSSASFVKYRISDVYNYDVFCKYKGVFSKYRISNQFFLLVLALFPKVILKKTYLFLKPYV